MTALIITPPTFRFRNQKSKLPSIFLAGSIGGAEDWQTKAIKSLNTMYSIIYNPRRAEWDDSWEQKITNPQFSAQVNLQLVIRKPCRQNHDVF